MHLHPLLATVPPAAWMSVGVGIGAQPVWLAAGIPVWAAALAAQRCTPAEPGQDEAALRRQLAVMRRHGVPADLLVARAADVDAEALRAAMRISDFAVVTRAPRGTVALRALVDTRSLDRGALERRLRDSLGGHWIFGWARFPDDGATHDALLDHARHQMLDTPTRSTHTEGI
jgi:hypothetical protein